MPSGKTAEFSAFAGIFCHQHVRGRMSQGEQNRENGCYVENNMHSVDEDNWAHNRSAPESGERQ